MLNFFSKRLANSYRPQKKFKIRWISRSNSSILAAGSVFPIDQKIESSILKRLAKASKRQQKRRLAVRYLRFIWNADATSPDHTDISSRGYATLRARTKNTSASMPQWPKIGRAHV